MWFQRNKDPEARPLEDLDTREVFILATTETAMASALAWTAGYVGSEALDAIMRANEVTGDSVLPGMTALALAAIALRLGIHGASDFAQAIEMRHEDRALDQGSLNEQVM